MADPILTAANILTDVVIDDQSILQYTLQGLPLYINIPQAVSVTGLYGFSSQAAAYAAALVLVQNDPRFLRGKPSTIDGNATIQQYELRPLQTQQEVMVVIHWIYNQISFQQTDWTIESDGFNEVVQVQNAFDSNGNLTPIVVDNYVRSWTDATKSNPVKIPSESGVTASYAPPVYGICPAFRPRKTYTYTKTIYSASQAAAFDAASNTYLGRVNSTVFNGFTGSGIQQNLGWQPGSVICQRARTVFAPYQASYTAVIIVAWRGFEPGGWQAWAHYSSPTDGDPPGNAFMLSATDMTKNNGFKLQNVQLSADLNQLLLLI